MPRKLLKLTVRSSLQYYLFSICASLVICLFIFVRLPEIIAHACWNSTTFLILIVVGFTIPTFFILPPTHLSSLVRRFGLLFLILLQLKNGIDYSMSKGWKYKSLIGHVVVVTGANSGIGYAVSKRLVSMDATVVMACKSSLKCDSSAKSILQAHPTAPDRIVTMTLDLSDLNSVWKFSNDVSARFDRIDILINNAGLVSEEGLRTKQGLEGLFGVMHMGHFALTKWLLPLLRKPFSSVEQSVTKPARVINIASEAFMFGSFHPSMLSNSSGFGDLHGEITDNCGSIGYSQLTVSCCPVMYCPHTNGYARAKLANVMHAKELQKVLDEEAIANLETCASGNLSGIALVDSENKFRRVLTASLHPGSVQTNIHPFFSSRLVTPILRSSDEASYVVMRAVQDDHFTPGSYIDALKRPHDLGTKEEKDVVINRHLEAFPLLGLLSPAPSFLRPTVIEASSLANFVWNRHNFIVPAAVSESGDKVVFRNEVVSARLWEVSEKFVENWMRQAGKAV